MSAGSRGPYGEPTVPLRVPRSLLPQIQDMLEQARERARSLHAHAAMGSTPTVRRLPTHSSARSS